MPSSILSAAAEVIKRDRLTAMAIAETSASQPDCEWIMGGSLTRKKADMPQNSRANALSATSLSFPDALKRHQAHSKGSPQTANHKEQTKEEVC